MKSLPDTSDLQVICSLYRGATGRSESRISDLACANPYLFSRLRANKGCTVATYNRVLAWFSAHWPEGLPWPAEIPRPPAPEVPERTVHDRAAAPEEGAGSGFALHGLSRDFDGRPSLSQRRRQTIIGTS